LVFCQEPHDVVVDVEIVVIVFFESALNWRLLRLLFVLTDREWQRLRRVCDENRRERKERARITEEECALAPNDDTEKKRGIRAVEHFFFSFAFPPLPSWPRRRAARRRAGVARSCWDPGLLLLLLLSRPFWSVGEGGNGERERVECGETAFFFSSRRRRAFFLPLSVVCFSLSFKERKYKHDEIKKRCLQKYERAG